MQVYEDALAQNSDLWQAANNLAFLIGETSDKKKDLERAMALVKRVLTVRPNQPSALDTYGWLLYKQGDYKLALEPLEKALAAAPESAELNYHVGMALVQLGRPEEARENLTRALESDEEFIGRDIAEKTLADI